MDAPKDIFRTIAEDNSAKHLLERFPKSVERFSDKKRDENKKLEQSIEPSEIKTALGGGNIFLNPAHGRKKD